MTIAQAKQGDGTTFYVPFANEAEPITLGDGSSSGQATALINPTFIKQSDGWYGQAGNDVAVISSFNGMANTLPVLRYLNTLPSLSDGEGHMLTGTNDGALRVQNQQRAVQTGTQVLASGETASWDLSGASYSTPPIRLITILVENVGATNDITDIDLKGSVNATNEKYFDSVPDLLGSPISFPTLSPGGTATRSVDLSRQLLTTLRIYNTSGPENLRVDAYMLTY